MATQIFFIFTPKIGEDEPSLTIIFFKWVGSTTNWRTCKMGRQKAMPKETAKGRKYINFWKRSTVDDVDVFSEIAHRCEHDTSLNKMMDLNLS